MTGYSAYSSNSISSSFVMLISCYKKNKTLAAFISMYKDNNNYEQNL